MTRRQASWASGSAHSGPARFPTKSWFMFCPKTWIRFRGGTWIMFGPRTWIKFLCNYLSKNPQVFFLKMAVFFIRKSALFGRPLSAPRNWKHTGNWKKFGQFGCNYCCQNLAFFVFKIRDLLKSRMPSFLNQYFVQKMIHVLRRNMVHVLIQNMIHVLGQNMVHVLSGNGSWLAAVSSVICL